MKKILILTITALVMGNALAKSETTEAGGPPVYTSECFIIPENDEHHPQVQQYISFMRNAWYGLGYRCYTSDAWIHDHTGPNEWVVCVNMDFWQGDCPLQ